MTEKYATAMSDQAFAELMTSVHKLGKEVVRPAADAVDKGARFPHEAFDAFKAAKLLSCYVPVAFGGMGLSIQQVCRICEALGGYCASTAMVFAMHQIQVACIVHHCESSDFFKQFLRELVDKQYILASATTEVGVGGDLRSSKCAVQVEGDEFKVHKEAPVISYALAADAIMVTCRKNDKAHAFEQVQVLTIKPNCTLDQIATWDAMGFRGTCSEGFSLKAWGKAEQIQPVPFADILAQTMHPVAHLTWGSLWLGLAQDAVNQARAAVRAAARKNPDAPPVSALRLAEVDELLFSMRSGLYLAIDEYQEKLNTGNLESSSDFGASIRTNNVKLRCSELVVEIVSKALIIVGINAYKNDTPNSLCRHLRDAYGAAIMVNNDRIRNHNATMQIMYRD